MSLSKTSFLICLLLLVSLSQLHAQCAPAPRVGGATFAYGVSDSGTPIQFVPSPYIVCDNAMLYYYGNNPDTIYLEGSTQLHVGSCFNLVVYMKNNAQLHCATDSSIRVFKHVIYDPTFTMFVDTAGSTFQTMTSCPGMTYSYAAFPNGTSPCASPTGLSSPKTPESMQIYPQPASGLLHLRLPASWSGSSNLSLYTLEGRHVTSQPILHGTSEIDVSGVPAGNYLLRVSQSARSIARIVTVQ